MEFAAKDVYPARCLPTALHVPSRPVPRKKVMKDATNAMSFLVGMLKIFPWLLARRLFCELFRIGERLVPKNGFKMKKHAILVLNAAIKFSGALQNVINAKRNWIWTRKSSQRRGR